MVSSPDRTGNELDSWLEYELPKNLLGKIWKGKYRGQKQKWFVMKFLGKPEEINVKTKNPEFLDWKWIELSKLPEIAVYGIIYYLTSMVFAVSYSFIKKY